MRLALTCYSPGLPGLQLPGAQLQHKLTGTRALAAPTSASELQPREGRAACFPAAGVALRWDPRLRGPPGLMEGGNDSFRSLRGFAPLRRREEEVTHNVG